MNYLSLYRKYRPHCFEDVVGQQYIVQILKNSIKNNKVANAYVFAGTKGTGKTSIAKIYANALNCLNNKEGDICHECEICKDFANNQVMDVIELDAASNNGVDDIRKISDAVYTLPVKLNKKVYIIDEAHMLTTQAWNALLKVVEEPPKHVVFIFATTEMHKIPTTILSRCQCFRFNKLLDSDIVKLLDKVCKKENFKYDLEALKVIAQIADGSARDSLSILEEVATFSDNNIKLEDIYKIYGMLSKDELVQYLNSLADEDPTSIFKKTNKYIQSGINFANFVSLIISIITDKLIYLKTQNYELLTKTNEKLMNDLRINDSDKLVKMLDIWQEAYFKVINPTDVNIVIEHAIIKTIAIFENKENVVEVKTPVAKPEVKVVKAEQPKVEVKTSKYEDVKAKPSKITFVCEEIFNSSKQHEPKVEKVEEVKPSDEMPSLDELLFAAVANRQQSKKNEAQQFLKDLKEGVMNEKIFSPISTSRQCFIASNNVIVYAYEDELDAKVLNKASFSNDFILATCKVFRNPKYIIGFSAEAINNMKTKLQIAMRDKTIQEPSLAPLRKILDADLTIEQLAYNEIYSKLDEKDRK